MRMSNVEIEATSCNSTLPSFDFHFNGEVEKAIKNDYCNAEVVKAIGISASEEKFSQLLKLLSTPPRFTTVRVNTLKISVEEGRKLLHRIIEQQYSKKVCPPPDVYCHPSLPAALIVACSRAQNTKIHSKQVIVGLKCGEAVLRGSDVFVPGVMGAPPSLKKDDSVSVFVDLHGLCCRGLVKSFEGPKMFVGNGISLVSRQDIFCNRNTMKGTAILMTEPLFDSPCLNGVLPDLFFLQNLPSIVCAQALNPQCTDIVLDMCAAPGGKTAHLATVMNNQGVLIAIDKTKPKVEKIIANCHLLGVTNVSACMYDSRKAVDLSIRNKDVLLGPPFCPESFDKILLDAPCSALGQRPQLHNKMMLKELQSYPQLQQKLFCVGVQLLKHGGHLVYSTCTLTLAENENLVRWALDRFPELTLLPQIPFLGTTGLLGSLLTPEESKLVQRFGTEINATCDLDTIGFFIAKFEKK